MKYRYRTVLSIAGSDCSGGAGIQADLKTIASLGLYGASVVTDVTAQNTCGVRAIQAIEPHIVREQLEAVFEDLTIDAVKIGMLLNAENVHAVAEVLERYRPRWVVLDPVMLSTSGSRLLEEEAIGCMVRELFPLAHLVTPNLPEAEYLTHTQIDSPEATLRAGERLLQSGCRAALLKGGHRDGFEVVDYFFCPGMQPETYANPRIDTPNTHGTGCTLSSAIACHLAETDDLGASIRLAKNYLQDALRWGSRVRVGHGHGPVGHGFRPFILDRWEIEP